MSLIVVKNMELCHKILRNDGRENAYTIMKNRRKFQWLSMKEDEPREVLFSLRTIKKTIPCCCIAKERSNVHWTRGFRQTEFDGKLHYHNVHRFVEVTRTITHELRLNSWHEFVKLIHAQDGYDVKHRVWIDKLMNCLLVSLQNEFSILWEWYI